MQIALPERILLAVLFLLPAVGVAQLEHQAYLKSFNDNEIERGRAVAVSGDIIALSGLAGEQSDLGNVVIYERRDGEEWLPVNVLKAFNAESGDDFGKAIALDGDTIVVGAPGEDSDATGIDGDGINNDQPDSGAVYVYVRTPEGKWNQQAYIKPSNTGKDDLFGSSVSLEGDTLVVGAPGESSDASGVGGNPGDNSLQSAGAAYVFVRQEGQWMQQAYLKASVPDAFDLFGNAVVVHRNWIMVGAPFERSAGTGVTGNPGDNSLVGAGAVYGFVRQGVNWSLFSYIKASNTDSLDRFGSALDMTSRPTPFGPEFLLAVGAPGEASNAINVGGNQDDNSQEDAGAVYLILGNGVGGWGQVGYLKASNTGADDEFGRQVAVTGGSTQRIVVGALFEDSIGTGVDGVQNDNSASNAGAAYTFLRQNQDTVPVNYLKASNTDEGDRFGFSVAADRSLIVVGAILEASDAIGANGNQSNNDAPLAGAAYVLGFPDQLFSDRFSD